MYTFDGINKIITVDSNNINLLEMYSRWKEWVLSFDNAKFLPAFLYHNDDTIEMINGWKIKVSI
jgi:hypothetical protein